MSGKKPELKALGDRLFKRYNEDLDSVEAWLAYIRHRGVALPVYNKIVTRLREISSGELILDVEHLTEAELNLAVDIAIACNYGIALRCLLGKDAISTQLISASIPLIPKKILQMLPLDLIRLGVATSAPKKESFVLSEFFYSAYLQ